MDVDFLEEIKAEVVDLPIITIVTQVDKLRPIREWQPPYNWKTGNKPKEISIWEATEYRSQVLVNHSTLVVTIVTNDVKPGRSAWNLDELFFWLWSAINPAEKLRLTRFLRNLETHITTTAKIIDHYTFQMVITQGLTALLKSPIVQFISNLSTGYSNLAYLLAE